jgi:hypothetical protein
MNRLVSSFGAVLVCAALGALWSGCETNSTTDGIAISPSDVTLVEGESQAFTVSGGYDSYTWSLEPDDGRAGLNPRTGDTAVFTLYSSSRTADDTNDWQSITIRCVSIIPGVSYETETTNPATINGYTYIAEGHVRFQAH